MRSELPKMYGKLMKKEYHLFIKQFVNSFFLFTIWNGFVNIICVLYFVENGRVHYSRPVGEFPALERTQTRETPCDSARDSASRRTEFSKQLVFFIYIKICVNKNLYLGNGHYSEGECDSEST